MKKNKIQLLAFSFFVLLPFSACSKSNEPERKIFCCSMTQQHLNHEYLDFKLEFSSYKNGYESVMIDKKICESPEMNDRYDFYLSSIPVDTHSIRISLISKNNNEWMTTGWISYKNNQVFSFAFNSLNDIVFEKTGFLDYQLPVIDFCNIFLKDINIYSRDEVNGYLSYPFYKNAFYNHFNKNDLSSNDVKEFSWQDTSYQPAKTITFAAKWNDFKKQYSANTSKYKILDYVLIISSAFLSIVGVVFIYVCWRKKRKIH